MPGGHIEAFYTLGGASHVPSCSHAGLHAPSQGGEQLLGGGGGGQSASPAPSKKNPVNMMITQVNMQIVTSTCDSTSK